MYAQVQTPKENNSRAVAKPIGQRKSATEQNFGFVDNRPEAVAQRKLLEIINASNQAVQRISSLEPSRKENNTGLPDNLKSGMETLSGHSLDHVRVHYNSSRPAAVQAHAYTQGSNIHLASGQEKHLAHELGHVVQQAQGRVKSTTSINGMAVNDNVGLEKEADSMGAKALQMKGEVENLKENTSPVGRQESRVGSLVSQKKRKATQDFGFVDNRLDAVQRKKFQELANNNIMVSQCVTAEGIGTRGVCGSETIQRFQDRLTRQEMEYVELSDQMLKEYICNARHYGIIQEEAEGLKNEAIRRHIDISTYTTPGEASLNILAVGRQTNTLHGMEASGKISTQGNAIYIKQGPGVKFESAVYIKGSCYIDKIKELEMRPRLAWVQNVLKHIVTITMADEENEPQSMKLITRNTLDGNPVTKPFYKEPVIMSRAMQTGTYFGSDGMCDFPNAAIETLTGDEGSVIRVEVDKVFSTWLCVLYRDEVVDVVNKIWTLEWAIDRNPKTGDLTINGAGFNDVGSNNSMAMVLTGGLANNL